MSVTCLRLILIVSSRRMVLSIESVDMLIERLSIIEQTSKQILESLERVNTHPQVGTFCPCIINSIDFFESGAIKRIVPSLNPICKCNT